jgi:hypothetical protein
MKQPWIRNAYFDGAWFILPTILPLLAIFLFPQITQYNNGELTLASWMFLILLIDVSHVYSTLYRTYFNSKALNEFNLLFKLTPVICLFAGILLYSMGSMVFWTCMAYLAVFHFIRQQYGFLRLYSRKETRSKIVRLIVNTSIYSVTLLPILMWHTHGQKNFNWFMQGDFIYFPSTILHALFKVLYFVSLSAYIATELILYFKTKTLNLPRTLLTLGTALSWYVGIVVYNADIVFTALNVIAHGIPYMALIWVAERPKARENQIGMFKMFFSTYGVFLFVGFLVLLAFIEEGIWDAFVWREHQSIFGAFYFFKQASGSKLLIFIIPLLSLPQIVHYVLDGFIWKRKENDKYLNERQR